MAIGISTCYRRSGLLYTKWRTFAGVDDDDVLVVKQPSTVFHDSDEVRREYARMAEFDPERAAAEYLSEWRSDLSDFVPREAVEACVPLGCYELPYVPRCSYYAFCDPSGGSSDSMTLAIAHFEHDKAVLDCLRERKSPFNPSDVCAEFAQVLKSYHLTRVTGDRYSGVWVIDRFAEVGVIYEHSEKTKIQLYQEVLPLIMRGGCPFSTMPNLCHNSSVWNGGPRAVAVTVLITNPAVSMISVTPLRVVWWRFQVMIAGKSCAAIF
jgi:hypothetical protein